jgi:hypothetical protein
MYLALGGSGARRSVDGGETWSDMNDVMGYSLMVDSRGTVFMGCMADGHPPAYSTDNGSTWEEIYLPGRESLRECILNGVSPRDVLFLGWFELAAETDHEITAS